MLTIRCFGVLGALNSNKIEQARDEVEACGSLSTELRRWLAPAKNWDRLSYLGKKHLLAALEEETEDLTEKQCQFEMDELQWRNDSRDCSAIPPKEALDRIHRYETSNVRHRYQVEKMLQELQARRKENEKAASDTGTGDYQRPECFLQDESKPA